jgi:hypothetical protein
MRCVFNGYRLNTHPYEAHRAWAIIALRPKVFHLQHLNSHRVRTVKKCGSAVENQPHQSIQSVMVSSGTCRK